MNNKQHSSSDEPNRDSNSASELQHAEQTARVLELNSFEDQFQNAESKDDQATAELGRLLRDAALANSTDSNVDLRKQLMAELDGGTMASESDEEAFGVEKLATSELTSRSTGRRFWVAAALSGLLLVGGTIAYNSGYVGKLSNVASFNAAKESISNSDRSAGVVNRSSGDGVGNTDLSSPSSQKPKVVYRMETRTREVPVTRMTSETKTGPGTAVTKYRDEIEQIRRADGSFKTETVKVPYTEMVPQPYTVQVPVQDQVTQSYQVPVPYTADGEPIARSDYGKYDLNNNGRLDNDSGLEMQELTESLAESDSESESALEEDLESAVVEDLLALNVQKASMGIELNIGDYDAGIVGGGVAPPEPLSVPGNDSKAGEFGKSWLAADKAALGGPPAEYSYEGKATLSGNQLSGRSSPTSDSSNSNSSSPLNAENDYFQLKDGAGRNNNGIDDQFRLQKGEVESRTGFSGERFRSGGKVSLPPEIIRMRAVQIENETHMVEELELQRDQLVIVRKFGPGHSSVSALDLAINERKARIAELEALSAGVEGKLSDNQNREKYRQFDNKSGGEQYEPIFENSFIAAKGPAAISTFSIDVDTASYANMRRILNSGRRPPPNSIRLEELVNYFEYDYPQPTGDHPFSVNLELADCPWQPGQQLLRIGLKGKDIHVAERPATNVVFLIDVSGSMSSNDKLPLLKSGFQMMSRQLGENDRVSIVTYAGNAGVVLEPTNGSQTSTINTAIEQLTSGGSTHGSAGIKLAYELAQQNFIQGGVNRVMLATDGDLNVGVTNDDALVGLIKEKAAEGVFLTVLGFGTGNLKDGKLEKLADNGNGVYSYIDSTREAHRVLVDQLSGSLVTIAKDVKIQVEFNPAEVKSYRLLGYENRKLETKDFDDDTKDAGEIGAGHTVTAIYQIEPTKAVTPNVSLPAGMKYQVNSPAKPADQVSAEGDDTNKDGLSKAAMSGELATVALRYKQPAANESQRLEISIKNNPESFNEASADFRFAASVAGFGMYLRNSEHKGSINAAQLLRIASESVGKDESGYRSEFIDLIRKAANH